jgi:xyloglucan-specific endo-beta-1,4-glucanase
MVVVRCPILMGLFVAAAYAGACSSGPTNSLAPGTGGSAVVSRGGSGGASVASAASGGAGGTSSGASATGGSSGAAGETSVGTGGIKGETGGTTSAVGGSGTSAGGRSGTGGTIGGTGGTTAGSGGAVGGTGGAAGKPGTGGTAGAVGAGGASGAPGGAGGGSTNTSGTCTAGATKIGNTCQSGWGAIMGKYILNNNWWGTTGATGQQCVWGTCQDGDVIGWVTNWNWSGGTSSVITYTSVVFGWQYGFQVSNTGLPIQVSSGKAINCGWDFALSQTSGGFNVAYDIWLHTSANPPSTGGQSDEIMIWLNKLGNPAPAGSNYASNISIGGATWTLAEGNVGWPVHSYLRTSNTTSAVLNIMAFLNDLVTRGRIPNTRYVTGVQAGLEVRSGGGTLTTNGFYCRIE